MRRGNLKWATPAQPLASPILSRIILHFVKPRSVVSIHQARRRKHSATALVKSSYIPNRIVRQDFFLAGRGARGFTVGGAFVLYWAQLKRSSRQLKFSRA